MSGPSGIEADSEAIIASLSRFVGAETWTESRRILQEHPESLSEEADQVLASLVASQQDKRAARLLSAHLELLRRSG